MTLTNNFSKKSILYTIFSSVHFSSPLLIFSPISFHTQFFPLYFLIPTFDLCPQSLVPIPSFKDFMDNFIEWSVIGARFKFGQIQSLSCQEWFAKWVVTWFPQHMEEHANKSPTVYVGCGNQCYVVIWNYKEFSVQVFKWFQNQRSAGCCSLKKTRTKDPSILVIAKT
jgi:hypothetical protein